MPAQHTSSSRALGVGVLLKDPKLLILDEPANGLDPEGINELREFLLTMANLGKTVLLSSHLLGEVEQLCTRVSIIKHGKTVAEGSIEDLTKEAIPTYTIEAPDQLAQLAMKELCAVDISASISADGKIEAESPDPSRITEVLADARIFLTGMARKRRTLEDIFLDLTSDSSS